MHALRGPFGANWDSLKAGYSALDWYRDAKFSLWVHWGQCVPEAGDWYVRHMYIQGPPLANPMFVRHWYRRCKELIDMYEPVQNTPIINPRPPRGLLGSSGSITGPLEIRQLAARLARQQLPSRRLNENLAATASNL